MIVAVTGATGFVGKRLVARLIRDGHAVVALTRSRAHAERTLPARCRAIAWDPERGQLAPTALDGVDAIVNLAGAGIADARWTPDRKEILRRSRIEGTRLLVQAMADTPVARRPRVLVSASAIGFYGDRGDAVLAEDAAPGGGFLAELCEAWERAAEAAESYDVRTARVRIGVVLGHGGGALARMVPPFRLGLGGRIGSGRQWMSWIHVEDLVRLFSFVIERTDVHGAVNGVAPNAVTNAEFTTLLARALGRPALLPVPPLALKFALGEMASVLLEGQRVVPAVAQALGFRFEHPDLEETLVGVTRDPSTVRVTEQWVPRLPDEVFRFFADPQNLVRITPPSLRLRILSSSTPLLETGTRIDYKLSLHGLPLRWQSMIWDWLPNRSFVDTQTRGPYQRWEHTHELDPYDGGTIIRDVVRYEVPFGTLGDAVAGRWVARDVDAIFGFRRAAIREIFGGT